MLSKVMYCATKSRDELGDSNVLESLNGNSELKAAGAQTCSAV